SERQLYLVLVIEPCQFRARPDDRATEVLSGPQSRNDRGESTRSQPATRMTVGAGDQAIAHAVDDDLPGVLIEAFEVDVRGADIAAEAPAANRYR
ncbi:hypothetical protein, partial [Nocardia cyriacigeorgica]|uniref:hypothetical protein n=1 Tax=Nocardia cyriacigeorgica TaxID=135487 RepID=UPI0024575A84